LEALNMQKKSKFLRLLIVGRAHHLASQIQSCKAKINFMKSSIF